MSGRHRPPFLGPPISVTYMTGRQRRRRKVGLCLSDSESIMWVILNLENKAVRWSWTAV